MSILLSVMGQNTSFFNLFSLKKAAQILNIYPRGKTSWISRRKHPVFMFSKMTICKVGI